MKKRPTTTLTRGVDSPHGLIKPEAFLKLYDAVPGVIGEVICELAEAGDLESCHAALASGILEKKEASKWSYAALPLLYAADDEQESRKFVETWLKATGGDSQDRLDQRLLGEMDPVMVQLLMGLGAKIGPVDSNGENALSYALGQGAAEVIRELVQGCNEHNCVPTLASGTSIIEYLGRLNEAYAVHFVRHVLGGCDDICDAIRKECGRVAAHTVGKNFPSSIRLSLMTIAKMEDPKSWESAFREGAFLKNSDSLFFTDVELQTRVIQNMLDQGVSINHRFFNAFSLKTTSGTLNPQSGTLLHAAAYRANTEMVIRLLDLGADPSYKSDGMIAQNVASSDETRSAFDAYAAKQNIERVLIKSKVDAILYGKSELAKKASKRQRPAQ